MMRESDAVDLENRVLLLAPTGRDAANGQAVLNRAGLACACCRNVEEVCRAMQDGAGAVLLTEEALSTEGARQLAGSLAKQPAWSDLPIAVLTRGGPDSPAALRAFESLGNVFLLERPVRVSTLVIALRTALRIRARQYEARRHLAALEDADLRKDQFLAMLGHELRNPLAPIRNAMEVFKLLVPDNPHVQHSREIIDRQVQHLTRLVDDLLDVSRITRGKVELRTERVDLAAVIASAVEASRPLLDARRQTLQISLPSDPIVLDADLTRLAQVISNLLNNAAKYSEDGGHVWLTARRDRNAAVVQVRDDGIGIPEEMVPKVFDLFTQVDGSLERSQGGLGIGLTLVRRLVEMHGGTVYAHSEGPGRGSEFTIRLPAASVVQLAKTDTTKGHLARSLPRSCASRRVLIVDDNMDAAESLATLLGLLNHDVRTAHDGPSALKLAARFLPQVIVLDIGLPGVDGYELAAQLRRQPELGQPLLIALTGYGQEDDRQRAHAAGFDHHLTKPADLDALQQLIGAG